jgi:hypothetical protein
MRLRAVEWAKRAAPVPIEAVSEARLGWIQKLSVRLVDGNQLYSSFPEAQLHLTFWLGAI